MRCGPILEIDVELVLDVVGGLAPVAARDGGVMPIHAGNRLDRGITEIEPRRLIARDRKSADPRGKVLQFVQNGAASRLCGRS